MFYRQKLISNFIIIVVIVFNLNVHAQCTLTGYSKVTQGQNFSAAIKNDGSLWVWGIGVNGIDGSGVGTNSIPHPVKVGTDNDWQDVSAGNSHIVALKTDGSVWVWGGNYYGQIGMGNVNTVYVPTKVGTSTYKAISAGFGQTFIIKTDGTLWVTGEDSTQSGLLGLGYSTTGVSAFTKVGSDNDWKSVSVGAQQTFAIKTDGTLWGAGSNTAGQLGLGTLTKTNSFIQVGTQNDWREVVSGDVHSLAIKNDGTLWGCGANNYYRQLGMPTFFYAGEFFQIGNDSNWKKVGVSIRNNTSFALKTDKTLWGFGENDYGKVGVNSISAVVSPPTQIPGSWIDIPYNFGLRHSCAIKDDTTLWSWGIDEYFVLGNDDGIKLYKAIPTNTTCSNNPLSTIESKNENEKYSIYPNPAYDFIEFKSAKKVSEVVIFDATGKLVKKISKPREKIDIRDLLPGIYMVNIGENVYKVIKK
ncbi:T9SS C-terminal target domain-containing protein [Chryseobacterium shandongense]|uniref:T9SS C-terminal target domain-containing protein n=1 Tax=Chryseobacterium shandongense TaxID=1493872 RepID=A0AAD0YE71_9FLAO|nr:T9SS type A sorting domain-containing protein [Chryseobacterium shandongense]AZA88477.1 T9SS C-terminal target domain-containing protein [Chryseobacterium shandongense]AZA97020.1 T9SS C-terminal target domain-containing protein [Chryseobacterium shandongense]